MNTISEKYRPETFDDLIIRKDILLQIKNWLDSWKDGIPAKRALLLWGSPGTGKTTTAITVARESGVPIIEMNSSDQRNAESMKRVALMASIYSDLFNDHKGDTKGFQRIILIDEADNIFEGRNSGTGGDFGGLSELSKIIAATHNPIIITLNDFYSFRRKNAGRDIINRSLVLEFKQYTRRGDLDYKTFRNKLTDRIREIASNEHLEFSSERIDELIQKNGQDIRSIINDIVSVLPYSDDKVLSLGASRRDAPVSIYNTISDTFKDRTYEKILIDLWNKDFTTEDYLMWIDQNLPYEADEADDLYKAYDILSVSDMFVGRVMKKQHYAFKGFAEEISAGISSKIEKPNKSYVKYEFPSYIMRMAALRETRETRKSLFLKLSTLMHTGSDKVNDNLWYFSYMTRNRNFLESAEKLLMLSEKEMAMLKTERKLH